MQFSSGKHHYLTVTFQKSFYDFSKIFSSLPADHSALEVEVRLQHSCLQEKRTNQASYT